MPPSLEMLSPLSADGKVSSVDDSHEYGDIGSVLEIPELTHDRLRLYTLITNSISSIYSYICMLNSYKFYLVFVLFNAHPVCIVTLASWTRCIINKVALMHFTVR